jgi:xylulokinase
VLHPGVRRYGLDAADASANVRALVEGQLMAMARHSRWMGVHIDVIHATGGAAENPAILDVMADVFNAEVLQVRGGNSAALGAALRAFHADRKADGLDVPWDEVVAGFADPISESRRVPDPARAAVYQGLIKVYASREAEALGGKKAPARRWETPPANMP